MVPTSNIVTRVFSLKLATAAASGFTVEVDGRQYLITAKHFVPSSLSSGTIEILQEKNWRPLNFVQIAVEPSAVDIAVLALSEQLTPWPLPVSLGFVGSYLSQEVFFLGFAQQVEVNGEAVNGGYPLPLVKHGIISYFASAGGPFLIDGINTYGFSGGPVVRVDNTDKPTVIGVVSGFRVAPEPVYQGASPVGAVAPPIGVTRTNAGLVVAFSIDYAIEAIRKRPIGYKIQ
jgi:hypothetical protein